MAKIDPIVVTFGAGINSRKRMSDISIDECVSGENFDLDPQQRALIKRQAFDKVATTPNVADIRGFAQLINQSGVITTLVQSGGNVYSWNGATTFTLVGTCDATSKLRGPREHNFLLDNVVIITDLNKATVVKQWDGTTFADFTHNLGTSLFAKFARVTHERLFLANVTSGTATPHVLLGSARGDDNNLTTVNRPSASLSESSAFFIPTPDLKPINGLEEGIGQQVISTTRGRLFALKGNSAFDFEIAEFYLGSSVSGDEAMVNVGNDIILGVDRHVESLSGVLSFGDVEANDLSREIDVNLLGVTDWKFAYHRPTQKVLCFPTTQAACWVLYKSLLYFGSQRQQAQAQFERVLSPWSKWTTTHSMAMQPTTVMSLINPVNGTEAVYCGDAAGNIYRFDGDGDKDGGTAAITVKRRSGLILVPNADIFNCRVNIDYRRGLQTDVTLRFIFSGMDTADATLSFTLSHDSGIAVYGGSFYYGGTTYYSSSTTGKIRRTQKHVQGRGNGLQVEIECSSAGALDIQQVEIILDAASS